MRVLQYSELDNRWRIDRTTVSWRSEMSIIRVFLVERWYLYRLEENWRMRTIDEDGHPDPSDDGDRKD